MLQYPKSPKVGGSNWRAKKGTLSDFVISIAAKHQKTEGDPLGKLFLRKNLTIPKKNRKVEPFGIFQHPFYRPTSKKLKGDPLRKIFLEKSHNAEKN